MQHYMLLSISIITEMVLIGYSLLLILCNAAVVLKCSSLALCYQQLRYVPLLSLLLTLACIRQCACRLSVRIAYTDLYCLCNVHAV
jgi:hypothetical protein